MKKILVPAILAAIVLVAGMFAVMPVEKASTVHTSIGSVILKSATSASTAAVDGEFIHITTSKLIKIFGIRVTTSGLGAAESFGDRSDGWVWDGWTGPGTDPGTDGCTEISGDEGTADILFGENSEHFCNDIEMIYPLLVKNFLNVQMDVTGTYNITVEVLYEGPADAVVTVIVGP